VRRAAWWWAQGRTDGPMINPAAELSEVVLKGGPLDGKTYRIHVGIQTIDAPAFGVRYRRLGTSRVFVPEREP